MQIDYRAFNVGVALSDKIVLEACPKCGKACHRVVKRGKSGSNTETYVHAAQIERVAPRDTKDGKPRLRNNEHNRFELSSPERARKYRTKATPIAWCSP